MDHILQTTENVCILIEIPLMFAAISPIANKSE